MFEWESAKLTIQNDSWFSKKKGGATVFLAFTPVRWVPNHWLPSFAHWAANET